MLKLIQQRSRQWPNVFQPICARAKQNYGERESRQVLFNGDLSIHGHEHIKLLLGEREEIAVLDSRPTLARYCGDNMSDQIVCQPSIYALVEQYLHSIAAASTRVFASSKKAITCSRDTLGKPSRKSSIESPPSR